MKELIGDAAQLLLDGEFDVLIHGCNCFNVMGSGIAKQIKDMIPGAYIADCATVKGDRSKLGTFSLYHDRDKKFLVVNAYTQYYYSNTECISDYRAIGRVMAQINYRYRGKGLRVCYPRIGAGKAGGDWIKIREIIDRELVDLDHTLIILDKEN